MPKTPTLVYKAKDPDAIQKWREDTDARFKEWQAKVDEWLKEIGKTEAIQRNSYDAVWLTGYVEEDQKVAPLPGWRRDTKHNRNFCVPALRSNAGKAAAKRINEVKVEFERPGLPEVVWGAGYMGTFSVQKLNGIWFAYITVPLRTNEGYGDGEAEVDKEVDSNLWEKAKLSEFFLAQEAATEEEKSDG